MKTIKITAGAHLVKGVHRTKDSPPFDVPDSIADDLVGVGHAEVVGGSALVHKGFVGGKEFADSMTEAYTPPLPADDPTHAARQLGSLVEEYPGLVALGNAGHPHAKTSGRYGPQKPGDVDIPAVPANPPEEPASPDEAIKVPKLNASADNPKPPVTIPTSGAK
jgi:hypothetical protein